MSDTISCNSCGSAFAKGDRFCPSCGTRAELGTETASKLETRIGTPGPTLCVICSSPMGRDDRFCPKCGTGRPEEATVVSHASLRNTQAAHLAEATRGEFEIIQQLGLGAMGSVYLANDVALSRKVAIKVIASNLLQDDSMVSRFRLEAQTVASLRHPNIVNVHAVRQAGELHYFVMDFIDGPALRTIVKGHAPLQVAVVQALLYQIGSALDYAHHRGKGVIHRDIKPANIMLDLEGNAFVTDFGISKIAESQTGLTQTGATIGTPEYMSPEQCRGEELTGASDQYAVGILAYEMLTGKTPFSGSQYHIMVAHTSEEPKPILAVRPDCPPHVAESVHRMLAKDPTARWPDLESAMAALGGTALGRKDPIREHITALAGSTAEVRAVDASSPLRPLPSKATAPQTDTATSVTILGMPARVEEGDTFTLSADVQAQTQGSMAGAAVSWSSSDPVIASVTNGHVRALKAGTAVVSASLGSLTNSVSVHVARATPVAVTVEPASVRLTSGERVSLNVRVLDRHGNELDRVIRWLTGDATVASVTSEGQLLATGVGTTTVTADSGGVTGTTEVEVHESAVRGTVRRDRGERSSPFRLATSVTLITVLGIGAVWGAVQLGFLGGPVDSDPPTRTGASGLVSEVAEVEVILEQSTIGVGDSMRVAFDAFDDAGRSLPNTEGDWVASDPNSVRFNGDWVVAQRAGLIELTAQVDGVSGSGSFRASDLTSAALPQEPQDDPGRPEGALEQRGTPLTSSTSANRDEPANVTVADDRPPEQPTSSGAEVTPPSPPTPSALTLAVPSLLEVNSTTQIDVDILDQDGRILPEAAGNVQLTSSNPTVVRIDNELPALEGVSEGSATISASLGGLSAGPFPVIVISPLRGIDVTSTPLELEIGSTGQARATARGPEGPLETYSVSWRSSDPAVATVTDDGIVNAVGAGSSILTASSGAFSATTSVTVREAPPAVPSDGEVRRLLDEYLGYLNDGDEGRVRSLNAANTGEDLDRLIDWIDNNNFEAALERIDPSVGTTVTFSVSMQYRSGFGGNQTQQRQFRAVLTLDQATWILVTVTMMPE